MGFKEQLETDLKVFINPTEFGELHVLGTKEIIMIIEDDSLSQLSDRPNDFENATQRLYESVTTIYVKAADYRKPAIGKKITLDGEKYYVIGSTVSEGILKINLVANESYG